MGWRAEFVRGSQNSYEVAFFDCNGKQVYVTYIIIIIIIIICNLFLSLVLTL
jgi:hypothetical protein